MNFRAVAGAVLLAWGGGAIAELPAEKIPNVATVPTPYPPTYAVVHDFAFSGLIDSKFAVVDTATRRFLGMMSAGQFATINFSIARQKFYVGETVHSRGSRGIRQDLITVYDFANLAVQNEIELPPKRLNVVINLASVALTRDDGFLLVSNMNPATSVTVIDLDSETVVDEIQTAGCSLVYPDAGRGFFSLCGNGGLTHVRLDEDGHEQARWHSKPFNDIDRDPLSEKAARIGDVWYFVTYAGAVQPIDVSGARPRAGKRWWLTSAAERAANWRPAGWHGKAANDSGLLWVAMMPDGYEGSHKDPAPQVWVVDVARKRVIERIELVVPALSIAVDEGGPDRPTRLLVVNVEGALDVYDARSGAYEHSIGEMGDTPYVVQAID